MELSCLLTQTKNPKSSINPRKRQCNQKHVSVTNVRFIPEIEGWLPLITAVSVSHLTNESQKKSHIYNMHKIALRAA